MFFESGLQDSDLLGGLGFQEACVLNRSWSFELIQWPQEQRLSRKTLIIVIIVSWKYQEFQQT